MKMVQYVKWCKFAINQFYGASIANGIANNGIFSL